MVSVKSIWSILENETTIPYLPIQAWTNIF